MDLNIVTLCERETDTELRIRTLDAAAPRLDDNDLEHLFIELAMASGGDVDMVAGRFQLIRVEPELLVLC